MSVKQDPIIAREQLAEGWERTQQSMALAGTPVPHYIHFQIDGRRQIRATRVAELDELAQAIDAIDEDIGRLIQGAPALSYTSSDLEELRQDKAALIELQKRAGRSGCPGSTTVIEALFPDIPVKKKTTSEKAEDEQWLAIRKEAGLKIDPETAEIGQDWGDEFDPYSVYDEWELPEELQCYGRNYWARSLGSDVWVHFSDLPDDIEEKIWARVSSQTVINAFRKGLPDMATEDSNVPF